MFGKFLHSPDGTPAGSEDAARYAADASLSAVPNRPIVPMESVITEVIGNSEFSIALNKQLIDILSSGYMCYIRRIISEAAVERVNQTVPQKRILKKGRTQERPDAKELEDKIVQDLAGVLLVEYVTNEENVTIPFPELVRQRIEPGFRMQVYLNGGFTDETIEEQELSPLLHDFFHNVFKSIAIAMIKNHYREIPREREVTLESHLREFYGYEDLDECAEYMSEDIFRVFRGDIDFKNKQFAFSMSQIRHACLNTMHVLHIRQLRHAVSRQRTALQPVDRAGVIKYLNDMGAREKLLDLPAQPLHKGKIHRPLTKEEIKFNSDVTVRIAGSDMDGNLVDSLDADIQLFQQTEDILTKWLDPFYRNFAKKELTPGEQLEIDTAIQEFHTKGGHAGKLNVDQIRYLMTHGVVLFLEKYIRDNIKIVIGTVSALTRTPCKPLEGEKEDPERWEQQAHQHFPNYDMSTLNNQQFGEEHNRAMRESAGRRIFIVRSSILHTLSSDNLRPQLQGQALPADWEGKSMRRLGLAARGKKEILDIADSMKRDSVGMNIGVINKPGTSLSMGNMSSTEHNSWVPVYTWRFGYTPLLQEKYFMNWVAHMADDIQIGQEAVTANLKAKSWNQVDIQNSTVKNLKALLRQIDADQHAPF